MGAATDMVAATAAHAEPTHEQYALAFRQRQHPNRGPRTLEAALADPVYRICLRQMALRMHRPRWQGQLVATSLPKGPAVPPTPTQPPAATSSSSARLYAGGGIGSWGKPRAVDMKRAAANDRDD